MLARFGVGAFPAMRLVEGLHKALRIALAAAGKHRRRDVKQQIESKKRPSRHVGFCDRGVAWAGLSSAFRDNGKCPCI